MRLIRFAGRTGIFALVVTLTFPVSARAEIDPRYYRQWQDAASEALFVRVVSVKPAVSTDKHPSGSGVLVSTRVDVEARVEKVERSASGLKPGDSIRIQYVSAEPKPPMPGPRPIPILKAGERYPAFLIAVSKGLYAPAAKGASFEPLIQAK